MNLLSIDVVRKLNIRDKIQSAARDLHMFDGTMLKTAGVIKLTVKHPRTKLEQILEFYVTTVHNQPLLGSDACVSFDLIRVNAENICSLSNQNSEISARDILTGYADLFDGYGELPG